jgi:hypothetical protein
MGARLTFVIVGAKKLLDISHDGHPTHGLRCFSRSSLSAARYEAQSAGSRRVREQARFWYRPCRSGCRSALLKEDRGRGDADLVGPGGQFLEGDALAGVGWNRPGGRDPALGFFQLVQPVDLDFARGHPGEQLECFSDPIYVGDDRRALPRGVVSDAEPESRLDVVEPGCGLESLEGGEHEEHADLSGLRCFMQDGLEDLAVVIDTGSSRGTRVGGLGLGVERSGLLYSGDDSQ